MKKTVFLLCFIILFIPKTQTQAALNDQTHSFGNFNIIIDDYREGGGRGISVEKTGTNPFYTTISDPVESYMINGVIQANDNFILFGNIHIEGNPTFYDTLFFVLNSQGEVIDKQIVDYGELEEIQGAYFLDGILIMHTFKARAYEYDFIFINNFFTSYDLSFNKIDSIEIRSEITQIYSDNKYIYFNFQYGDRLDGAIRDDLSILLPMDIIDISNNEVFIDNVFIEFLNEALLNDEIVQNGIYLDYPGNYKLLHNNAEYNFVLKPIVSGIENNTSYTESVTPVISSGNILMNNDIFISGTEISNPGNYELTVNGINNYIENYNFTITSNMEGIVNDHTYFEPVEILFNGEGFLNNQLVTSPLIVTDAGEYILKLRGDNNYLETYYFQIDTETDKLSIVDFIQRFDIYILVIVLISGGIIIKKK